jgi:hypothetical protein
MSLPIYQRVAVTDAGDVIPGAEYTVINENTGVAAPIYSDRTGATLLTAPYFADSVGTIQFFIAQGTTFRVAASGGVGTYTDRYVYGVAEAVLVQADGNVGIGTTSTSAPLQVVSGENLVAKFSSSDVTSGIRIEDTTTSYDFYVDSGNLRINNTAGLERLRIDAAGDVEFSSGNGGIYLGGRAAANRLDDYEEGGWLPSIQGATTAGVGNYNLYRQGYYTKVGELVNLSCIVGLNSHTGSGYMRITGLPFPCTSNGNSFSAVTFGEYSLAVPNGRVLTGTISTNSSNLSLQSISNAIGGSSVFQLDLDPDFAYVIFSVTYRTDA